jgi:AcrR family transcriptional regulator
MPKKSPEKQAVIRRQPRQERARQKAQLILEATLRLIERGDVRSVTTNAIAATAGISIGTLYQYFAGKEEILEALVATELAGIAERVSGVLSGPAPAQDGGRVSAVMRAVLESYGGRRRAHRQLMDHSLSRGAGRLNPFFQTLIKSLSSDGTLRRSDGSEALSEADAFVLTHAIAGVIRGHVGSTNQHLRADDIEQSLTRLVLGFVQPARG